MTVSSYLILNRLNTSSKWFFISTNEKSTYFLPDVSSTTAISFAFKKLLRVIRLILIYVLTLNLSGKLGSNFPK